MGKIICDICGATYPDTDDLCPICGTAKADAAIAAVDTAAQGDSPVKGGRFSQNNVKRQSGNPEQQAEPAQPEAEEKPVRREPRPERKTAERNPAAERRERRQREEDESSNNIGLIIIAIILVMAIVAICAFLVTKWLGGQPQNPVGSNPGTTQGQHQTKPTTPNGSTVVGPVSIPCTGLRLSVPEFTFANRGDTLQITPITEPENTTEEVRYISSDDRIATVDENGIVTAVADGVATIYVYCGSFKVELAVTCNVGVEPPLPTDPLPTDPQPTDPLPTDPPIVLELNRKDFTLTGYGATWRLYTGEIDCSEITFTSNDEEVATVDENGKVTAVGNGRAIITAEYLDQKVTCIVRCAGVEKPANTDYEVRTIYGPATDITLKVGETLKLQLVSKEDGLRVDPSELTFTVAKEGYVTVDEEGRVKGVEPISGGVYVYIEYQGVTYKCLVRVRAAE